MRDIEGFILTGGASSRMGVDKALLELGRRTFVERIYSALEIISTRICLVGRSEKFAALPSLPTVPDIHVKWGALGGLHAAIKACKAEWAAVVACDLPFVTGELFVRLASLRENFDAIVPVQADGHLQPLCALYRSKVCRERAEDLIAEGERRPRALLERVRTRLVAFDELSDLHQATLFFMNINTPQEFADAKRKENSDE